MDLLEGLNEWQRQGVLHGEGPLLILAGAGSGKTRVITYRIAHLCEQRGVKPWNIVAVTFTNKAVEEMRNRVHTLLGAVGRDVTIRTFHSLGLLILSRHAAEAGLRHNFSVYDDAAQKTLLKAILKDHEIDPRFLPHDAAAHAINRLRDAFVSPEEAGKGGGHYEKEIALVYREYVKRLRENNAIDFGGLLYESVSLLQNNGAVLAYYQNLWHHFLIDEYQDTNHCQYLMGKLIAGKHKNIVVVGDDDQSIYSWRGADIENILNFEKDYPGCPVIRLEENYRSTMPILKAASELIAHNTQRKGKTLFTEKEGGEAITLDVYGSDTEEVASILSKIRSFVSHGYAYRDIAVFYRTNAQSRLFEQAFTEEGIPFLLVGGFRFFERKEIKDLVAYLSVIVNPDDSIGLERIINVPPRGIGEVGLAKLSTLAAEKKISLFEALHHADELKSFRGVARVRDLYHLLSTLREAYLGGELPSILVHHLSERSGYLDMLKRDAGPEAISRIENIEEFQNYVREYEERMLKGEEEVDLARFLQSVSIQTSATETSETEEGVSMMTLHNAKGLEYPVVFLSGMEEGLIPHKLSIEEGNLEEERRLLYVGVTRARERLCLSGSQFRRVFGTFQPRLLSRFIEEMGLERSSVGSSREGRERFDRGAPVTGSDERFEQGERVFHQKYGEGEVVYVEATPSGQKISIHFDRDQTRRNFLTAYTPVVKL